MKELSLHILDIVQNSISACADFIRIDVAVDIEADLLVFTIEDNGKGMDAQLLKTVSDPFATTRTTRKVGLGISLLKAAAEGCDGGLEISSVQGKGTKVKAWFAYGHIDRAPLGDMVETIVSLVACNPAIDFVYRHSMGEKPFEFDTCEIKKVLGEVSINNIEVISWIRDYCREGIESLYGGVE